MRAGTSHAQATKAFEIKRAYPIRRQLFPALTLFQLSFQEPPTKGGTYKIRTSKATFDETEFRGIVIKLHKVSDEVELGKIRTGTRMCHKLIVPCHGMGHARGDMLPPCKRPYKRNSYKLPEVCGVSEDAEAKQSRNAKASWGDQVREQP